jgi:cell division septum initiation protein DivIVA
MSFQQWLQHGEMLYQSAMQEHHALEAQLDELERRLAAKQTELNQIAQMMSKPPVEGARRVSAQIMTPPPISEEADRMSNGANSNSTSATIARALTGKVVRQPM